MNELKNRFIPKGATPGPWRVCPGGPGGTEAVYDPDGYLIADTWDVGAVQNARLIAKAPDLAQKLEEAVRLLEDVRFGAAREWRPGIDAFLESLKPLEEVDG